MNENQRTRLNEVIRHLNEAAREVEDKNLSIHLRWLADEVSDIANNKQAEIDEAMKILGFGG
jgi:hypothetical protein